MQTRSINWFESTCRNLASRFSERPDIQGRSDYLTLKLTRIFFERLPEAVARTLFALLPEDSKNELRSLRENFNAAGETSIGYPDFVAAAKIALGGDEPEEFYREIADRFLWSIAREIPADLKGDLLRLLPCELTSRMDLFSAVDENKVA